MSAYRAREPRQPVKIGARLKSGLGWSDVVLRNVSARGVMGECTAPPARGDYVELRCGPSVIVARVAWSGDDRFGARAQDRIELGDLITCAEGRPPQGTERRRHDRPIKAAQRAPTLVERSFASARFGRAFEFFSLILAGTALATLLVGTTHNALARPVAKASRAMAAGKAQ
jgi:hypothetical protein